MLYVQVYMQIYLPLGRFFLRLSVASIASLPWRTRTVAWSHTLLLRSRHRIRKRCRYAVEWSRKTEVHISTDALVYGGGVYVRKNRN